MVVDLAELSWREFMVLVRGLISADTRIGRRFAPAPEQTGVEPSPVFPD